MYTSPSPYNNPEYVHYAPHEQVQTKRHSRKASYTQSPKPGGWYSPATSPSAYYDANIEYALPRKNVYVSTEKGRASKHEGYTYPSTRQYSRTTTTMRKQTQPVHIYDDEAEYAQPQYLFRSPSKKVKHSKKPSTDTYFYYGQDQIHEEQPNRARARRPSTSSNTKPSPKGKSTPTTPHATEKDAIRAGIPAGYSIKNWDPTELPIVLLGSVFDANSLGKWIYDWTVYRNGASTPMADVAGELWLLLIKLAGKMKRAEECMPRIRNLDNRDMVEDFISSGDRLWEKVKGLLKDCEFYMLKAARREGSKTMGKNAGVEFVDSIFGRDRFLETTEKLMNAIRMWNMRFDVNCEDILRRPSAA